MSQPWNWVAKIKWRDQFIEIKKIKELNKKLRVKELHECVKSDITMISVSSITDIKAVNNIFRECGKATKLYFQSFIFQRTVFVCLVLFFEGGAKREKEIIYNYDKNKESTVSSSLCKTWVWKEKKKLSLRNFKRITAFSETQTSKKEKERKKERKNYKWRIWGYTELNSLQTLNENMIPSRANVRWLGKLYIFLMVELKMRLSVTGLTIGHGLTRILEEYGIYILTW